MTYAQAKIDLMLQDENLGTTGRQLIEYKELRLDDDTYDRFLDGPTCRRVAVVDFDPATGSPLPAPAKLDPDDPRRHGDVSSPTPTTATLQNSWLSTHSEPSSRQSACSKSPARWVDGSSGRSTGSSCSLFRGPANGPTLSMAA